MGVKLLNKSDGYENYRAKGCENNLNIESNLKIQIIETDPLSVIWMFFAFILSAISISNLLQPSSNNALHF